MFKHGLKFSAFVSYSVILALLIFTTRMQSAQGQLLNTVPLTSSVVKVSDDLANSLLNPSSARLNLIVQLNGPLGPVLRTLITAIGGQITAEFDNFDMIAVNLPATSLAQLLTLPGIIYVSPDRPTAMMGHCCIWKLRKAS